MARLLVHAAGRETGNLSGDWKKGYLVGVFPDSHIFGNLEKPPLFIVIDCPVAVSEAQNYLQQWDRSVDYNVISTNAGTATYTIEVYGDNASPSGGAAITRSMVESYLTRWGAVVDSFSANSVTFTVALWDTLRSNGFWNVDVSAFTFTLNGYDSITGVATVTVSNLPAQAVERAISIVGSQGGTVTQNTTSSVTFNIHRSVVIDAFKDDVKQSARATYQRKQYQFSDTIVDDALATDGVLSATTQQVLSALVDWRSV